LLFFFFRFIQLLFGARLRWMSNPDFGSSCYFYHSSKSRRPFILVYRTKNSYSGAKGLVVCSLIRSSQHCCCCCYYSPLEPRGFLFSPSSSESIWHHHHHPSRLTVAFVVGTAESESQKRVKRTDKSIENLIPSCS